MVFHILFFIYSLLYQYFRDFLGPSAGGFLSDTIGFKLMCTSSAALCLLMVCRQTLAHIFNHGLGWGR